METHVAPSMLFSCCITASEDVTRDPVEGVAGISTSTMEMPATPSMLFSCCITANGDVTVANITVIYNSVDPASTRTCVRVETAADKQMCSPLFQLRHRSRVQSGLMMQSSFSLLPR